MKTMTAMFVADVHTVAALSAKRAMEVLLVVHHTAAAQAERQHPIVAVQAALNAMRARFEDSISNRLLRILDGLPNPLPAPGELRDLLQRLQPAGQPDTELATKVGVTLAVRALGKALEELHGGLAAGEQCQTSAIVALVGENLAFWAVESHKAAQDWLAAQHPDLAGHGFDVAYVVDGAPVAVVSPHPPSPFIDEGDLVVQYKAIMNRLLGGTVERGLAAAFTGIEASIRPPPAQS